jgi:hypothetical protein
MIYKIDQLHYYIYHNDIRAIKYLLNNNLILMNINIQDKDGYE